MPMTFELPRTKRVASHVVMVEEIDSTNTLARQLVLDGALQVRSGEVAVVAAERQTAGRGRLGHTWTSLTGESFTMSFVAAVPRAVAVDESVNGWLQMIAGLAAVDGLESAISEVGERWLDGGPTLKWPNDIFVNGRKLGGILCELVIPPANGGAVDSNTDAVTIVMGIGLNLAVPENWLPTPESTSLQLCVGSVRDTLSDDIGDRDSIGATAAIVATDDTVSANAAANIADLCDVIAAGIISSLVRRLTTFAQAPTEESKHLLKEATSRCYTLGRPAIAHFTDGSELAGEAISLNADASLTMRTPDGQLHCIRTADVGVLPRALSA